MSWKSIYKNRNKRCDRLAIHILFSAKNRIYKQNTHTHTQSGAENSRPLQKRFLPSISRKRLTIEISALDELMVLSIHALLVSQSCGLTSPQLHTNWLHSKNPKEETWFIIIKTQTINNLTRINLKHGTNKLTRHEIQF